MLNIRQIRNETPGAKYAAHFNNAGAALPCHDTLQVIQNYLNKEARTGGYLMQELYADQIQNFYKNAAQLINCSPAEIAITANATDSQAKVLFGFPFKRGDVVLTGELEYSNNYMNLLLLKKTKGIKIRVVNCERDSSLDLQKFENAIDEKVKLIAMTHIPTSSGQIVPAEAIGKIAKKYGIPYLLDTCQSIGHMPVDVEKIGCDFATATARKYLRGPRGLGFLYVKKSRQEMLMPPHIEAWFASWDSKTAYSFEKSIKMFEGFERSYALILGFSTAIEYQNKLGIENTWERIQSSAALLRERLNALKKTKVVDPDGATSGIITFVKKGISANGIVQKLREQKINTSTTTPVSGLLDLKRRKLSEACRASVHYYNSEEEMEKLIKAVDAL